MKSRTQPRQWQQTLFPEMEASSRQHWQSEKVEFDVMVEINTNQRSENRAKTLGAYYTDSLIADFLVAWALRNPAETALDPSFGGGVFLRSAAKRIKMLGGKPCGQIFGVELESEVHSEISCLLAREFGINRSSLEQSDFFQVLPGKIPKVDVLVGNPPFIRYQRFTGDTRSTALSRAAEEGIKISALSSSWLPFLIHSIRFLNTGGRLAMVIPFEIGHASYAKPVLGHLSQKFASVTFLTFRKKLFPLLSEDTLLLLAEGKQENGPSARFYLRDFEHAGELQAPKPSKSMRFASTQKLDTNRIVSGQQRLIEALIPSQARDLYTHLCGSPSVARLGEFADVGIGYVTGANDFFHLSVEAATYWKIPSDFLRPAVRRGRSLSGLRLTKSDWNSLLENDTNDAGFLLQLPSEGPLPKAVSNYLDFGKQSGIDAAFKCRTRKPWYRVPHVYQPDSFLTYMSGDVPRLVANEAEVVAPNSLHVLRLHPGGTVSSATLSALWQSSLTQLSVEIEGHALGGGMLKLEPTEAEKVILPRIPFSEKLAQLAGELDSISRKRGAPACLELANRKLLKEHLGLSKSDIDILHTSAELLRSRRYSRGHSL